MEERGVAVRPEVSLHRAHPLRPALGRCREDPIEEADAVAQGAGRNPHGVQSLEVERIGGDVDGRAEAIEGRSTATSIGRCVAS